MNIFHVLYLHIAALSVIIVLREDKTKNYFEMSIYDEF